MSVSNTKFSPRTVYCYKNYLKGKWAWHRFGKPVHYISRNKLKKYPVDKGEKTAKIYCLSRKD